MEISANGRMIDGYVPSVIVMGALEPSPAGCPQCDLHVTSAKEGTTTPVASAVNDLRLETHQMDLIELLGSNSNLVSRGSKSEIQSAKIMSAKKDISQACKAHRAILCWQYAMLC